MIAILLRAGVALADPSWVELMPLVEAGDRAVVVVRVLDSPTDQAPMVHMKVGPDSFELACTDDGSFPDPAPDDGVFHCARLMEPAIITAGEWSARFSVRGGNGEDQYLGELRYPGEGGFHYATVTLGKSEAASASRFDLSPKASNLPEAAAVAEPTPSPDADGTPPAPPEPPPSPAGPAAPDSSAAAGSLGSTVAWAVLAGCVGWALGRRRRPDSGVEGGAVLAVGPIDGAGPSPPTPALVAATDPSSTALVAIGALTASRRVVVVGDPPDAMEASGHDVVVVNDPDVNAVEAVVRRMINDGGVPPVVVVLGSRALIDTSGASSDPRMDLLRGLPESVWTLLIDESDSVAPADVAGWSHDPQAGWSRI